MLLQVCICSRGSLFDVTCCLTRGVSIQMVSVQEGFLSGRFFVRETPHTVKSGRYTSY